MIQFWISKERDVFHNLAIESWLFKENDGSHILFWVNEPSVVIGRNQIPWKEAHLKELYSMDASLARRISGGGAVYHDGGNLNISFINVSTKDDHYRLIKETLDGFGIEAKIDARGGISASQGKFSGSAYYLYQGKLLHHLTLLVDSDLDKLWTFLKISNEATTSKAVESVREKVVNLSDLSPELTTGKLIDSILAQYQACSLREITVAENNEIDKYVQEFRSWEWIFGKTPEFLKKHQGCEVKVIKGRIAEITGDDRLKNRIGAPYRPDYFEYDNLKEEQNVF
ncbi:MULTISPECIES: lipoate--protein ligase [unclassified Fusibacter]|uniref:lipoate--protein ligase n=1 Tax=unclassified Fusibacter TaxID=2624464 RepID=UPI00101240BE|nr:MULTISPECIES: lipoate--protein ligase [unclassified Fusibacter]MCK8061309.1 lipoate--protein ligase [Fusibacter sp. A2]NPE23494.1 lipoate--protein ligase [Fusibacter sp. A1]RXV59100.1 hypothetical protein DWB64_16885 [Fusibacter sp. A1]